MLEAQLSQQSVDLRKRVDDGRLSTVAGPPGYKQLTFGGINTVPTVCLVATAAAAPYESVDRVHPVPRVFQGRARSADAAQKRSSHKVQFAGQADIARTAAGRSASITKRSRAMKTFILFLAAAAALSAQVSAVVSDQGSDVIRQTTGYRPKSATLRASTSATPGMPTRMSPPRASTARSFFCSSSIRSTIFRRGRERGAWCNSSSAMFSRGRKRSLRPGRLPPRCLGAVPDAGAQTVAILQAAPSIAQAILPAAGDPRDLAALGQNLPDNATLVLGKKGWVTTATPR